MQDVVGEYLKGNTLVMDLILKFQLDKEKVGHGLKVAAFATEMAFFIGPERTGKWRTAGGLFWRYVQ